MACPDPDRSRAALIDAAATLFRRQGYAATGLNQILDEAGVRPGSLYHHFPQGKQQLAAAVGRRRRGRHRRAAAAAAGQRHPGGRHRRPVGRRPYRRADRGLARRMPDRADRHRVGPCQRAGPRGVGARVRRLVHGNRASGCDSDGWPAADAKSVAVAVISLIEGALILVPGLRRRNPAGGRQISGPAAAAPLDVQADVEHPHRMGERADGEIIHTGPGVLGGGVQRKPAGRLEFGGR